jgi:hypothetical protein
VEAALKNTMNRRKNPRLGGSLDDFLKGEGIYEETQAFGIEDVVH